MPVSTLVVPLTPTAPPSMTISATSIQLADYSRYRFRAEVDWIELRIVTATPTNFQTVKRRLGVDFVEPEGSGLGGACTEFSVKFQSPASWAEIDARLRTLTADHSFGEPVAVTGVEIALDAYSRNNSRDDLIEMTASFYRCACKLVSTNRRASRKKGESQGLNTLPQLRQLVTDGFNIYIGEKTDNQRQHIYLKETDRGGLMPLAEHRARTEVTLTGDQIPEAAFGGWKTRDFTEFASFFKFRSLKPALPLLVAAPLKSSVQIGEARMRKSAKGHCRAFSRSTQADAKLNALAFDALRELSRRWKAAI